MNDITLYHGTIYEFDTIDLNRVYGDPSSELAIRTFLQYILPDRLPHQIFFGTQKATLLLRFVERRAIQ
jgi:hypothetical protein